MTLTTRRSRLDIPAKPWGPSCPERTGSIHHLRSTWWDLLEEARDHCFPTMASTLDRLAPEASRLGLVPDQTYVVIQAFEDPWGKRWIRLEDPHGDVIDVTLEQFHTCFEILLITDH